MKMAREKGELQEKLISQLSQELPGCQIQDIRAFVHHALYAHADTTFETIIHNFLGNGIHAGKVLATLLRCEWSNINWLLIDFHKRDLSDQVAAFSDCIGHYNNLQAAIIEAAESAWEQSLDDEKRARVLAESKIQWFRDRHIELHNYFQEIPVRAKLKLLDTVDDEISVAFAADAGMVFAASVDLNTAYISVAGGMRLMVRGIECRNGRIRLAIVGVEPDPMSRRNYVRVARSRPIPITLHGKKKYQAYICDKSERGLGVLFLKKTGAELINSGELKAGDKIICRWRPGDSELKAQASIRWIRKIGNEYRAGLTIDPDPATHRHLQQLLMQHQRDIVTRLRQLGLPVWMQQ